LDRANKEQLVATLHELFDSTNLLVVTCPLGLTVAQSTDLRRRMRDAGASFKVTKNRLTRIALKGTKFEPLTDLFTGPTGIAYSDDPVAAAKVAVEFSEKNDLLKILGGGMGEQVLDVADVNALAKLPSLDELRGRLVGMVQTPATRIAGILQAPGGQIARVLNAHASQGEAA
jgi:large subunit ribosomal protein L10